MLFSSRLARFLLPVLSGCLLMIAYPGWDWEFGVWIWLFPLLLLLWPLPGADGKVPAVKSPFWLGLLAGLAFWVPNLAWLRHSSRVIEGARDNTWMGLGPELLGAAAVLGLASYCALYVGVWAWFVARYARPSVQRLAGGSWQVSTGHSLRCAGLAAAAWVGLEWMRSYFPFTGFGWNGLGVALHNNSVLIQVVDIVGVTGLSFLPVFVACSGWNAVTRMVAVYRGLGQCRSRVDFTLAMVLLLGVVGYGMRQLMNLRNVETVTVRTVLVQPNVAQVDAWSGDLGPEIYQKLNDYTRLNAEARDGVTYTDLVIWPESALPVHLYGLADHKPYFDELLAAGDYSLLTGTEIHDRESAGHNSAVLFRGNYENRQIYHKMHLVPFGEYLPLRTIPPFSFLKGLLPGDFDPGAEAEPLLLAKPEVQIIPLICFEDTVGRLARRFVRAAPQMIVNITNDGWFLQSAETQIHLANAKFRAIELRRPMVRAANTGISCFIDIAGRVTSQLADPKSGNTFVEGFLPGEVRVPKEGIFTFYARNGDVCALVLTVVALLPFLSHLRRRKKAEL